MLTVKTPDEALEVIRGSFCCIAGEENVPLDQAAGRVLCKDIYASEYVPGFDRSTVDGYAVRAADTFGCTDAIPAILEKQSRFVRAAVCLYQPEVRCLKAQMRR